MIEEAKALEGRVNEHFGPENKWRFIWVPDRTTQVHAQHPEARSNIGGPGWGQRGRVTTKELGLGAV
eukprot:12938494-Prorocentrum_lima.AAC.1